MKKTAFLIVLTTLGLLLNTSCKKKDLMLSDSETFDLAAAKAAVEDVYTDFETAFNAKDAMSLANCYAIDGKFMGPNMKAVQGRANIAQTFKEWFKEDTSRIDLTLVDIWGNENNLTVENTWKISDKDGKVLDEGKSIEVYKMEDDKWKMVRDCYNSDMPPMPMGK